MKIWIDLANSPHVLLFKPIIEELEKHGHHVLITHRDFAQTSLLCDLFKVDSEVMGAHGGQGVVRKIKNIARRATRLRACAKGEKIDLAISHNSYAHCIAAKSLGIPYITMMDYEHQPANHINFRLADKIFVPFTFHLKDIRKYGVTRKKMVKYPGLKENIHLWQFRRDIHFWEKEFPELNNEKIICIIRPPATMAAYHNFENPIFYELMKFLLSHESLQIIFFPRTNKQQIEFKSNFPALFIAEKPVSGDQLIANSDLVISAGGTMNREAAVLGTPAYSVYAGKMGSVDQFLDKTGKIGRLDKQEDFKMIQLKKKKMKEPVLGKYVFDFIIQHILEFGEAVENHRIWF